MKILGAILLTDLAQGYGVLDSQAALSISVFSFSVHTVSQTLSGLQLLCQEILFFWGGLQVPYILQSCLLWWGSIGGLC